MLPSHPRSRRRSVLKTAGLTLALPMLESRQSGATESVAPEADAKAKRLICVGSNLGVYRPAFYPQETGTQYELSPLLKHLERHRDDFTVFSGFDHRAGNGHKLWDNYLCGRRVGSVSMDQIAAEKIGRDTRFESMQLCAGDIPQQRMVFSRHGVPLPMVNRPSTVYQTLFATGENRKRREYLLRSGKSALDAAGEEVKRLRSQVSSNDRQTLSEYFSSLRELELRMQRQLRHLADDDATVDYELPPYDPIAPTLMLECEQIMYDLMALALQTDSTRVATMFIAGLGQVFTLDGETLRAGYHALSHHGNDPDLIRDLVRVESEHMKCLARFLDQLKAKRDADGNPLLDSTIVMFGTGMGDASRHSNRDLPTLVAGGGFQHGQHVQCKPDAGDSRLLGDVFLSILDQLGAPQPSFDDATRGIHGWT